MLEFFETNNPISEKPTDDEVGVTTLWIKRYSKEFADALIDYQSRLTKRGLPKECFKVKDRGAWTKKADGSIRDVQQLPNVTPKSIKLAPEEAEGFDYLFNAARREIKTTCTLDGYDVKWTGNNYSTSKVSDFTMVMYKVNSRGIPTGVFAAQIRLELSDWDTSLKTDEKTKQKKVAFSSFTLTRERIDNPKYCYKQLLGGVEPIKMNRGKSRIKLTFDDIIS